MYGVVETSKVKAVKVGRIHSVLAELPTGLENGMIVKVGDLAAGEKDVRQVEALAGTEKVGEDMVAIIATPEVNYEDSKITDRALGSFYIKNGEVGDAVEIVKGDEFTVSENLVDFSTVTFDDAKYLVPKGMKYEAKTSKPSAGVALKINKANCRQMFADNFLIGGAHGYKMIAVTVEA